jgi:HD superfamily phosphohydrolase
MPHSGNASPVTRTKVIRDNIHGYIALTELERQLLAQPEFHRLHFISQNGLAFHTYPATKHTRFLHSLGAMHLAGRILISAMRKNAPAARSLRDALSAYGAEKHKWLFASSRTDLFSDGLYLDLGIADDKLLCIMFQAVRIASLIHDIGHPPFSHTVEEAMQMLTAGSRTGTEDRGGTAEPAGALREAMETLPDQAGGLHERIGSYLVHDVMISGLAEAELQELGSRLVDFAIEISAHYEWHPTLRALKGVVDGEFDCDRADYVLRDCAAAGVDFGGYDLERIIPEMTVVEEDGQWFFRPTLRALSAIEAFYEERSKLYRWIVFHHSCVRSHIALQRATIGAIRLYERSNEFTSEELKALHQVVEPIERLWTFNDYRLCDEAWYFSFLANLLDRIRMFIDQAEKKGKRPSAALLDLQGYTEQARWRVKKMIPLWKSINQYRDFCEGVLAAIGAADDRDTQPSAAQVIRAANACLLERLQRPLKVEGLRFLDWMESELASRCGRRLALHLAVFKYVGEDQAANQQPRGKGVFLVEEGGGESGVSPLIPLADVSPVPASLETVWENSIRFRAYALTWNSETGELISPRRVGVALGEILTSDEFSHQWHSLFATTPETLTEENNL